MEKIPTAEEFMNRPFGQALDTQTLMIKFAKLHVEAALKTASINAELDYGEGSCRDCASNKINKESILTAYPLENIK